MYVIYFIVSERWCVSYITVGKGGEEGGGGSERGGREWGVGGAGGWVHKPLLLANNYCYATDT